MRATADEPAAAGRPHLADAAPRRAIAIDRDIDQGARQAVKPQVTRILWPNLPAVERGASRDCACGGRPSPESTGIA
eukprot:366135-Chlamydomonas_euryale.AAC.7